jgi:hypothetical protein
LKKILRFIPAARLLPTVVAFRPGTDHVSEKICVSIDAVDSALATLKRGKMRSMLASKKVPTSKEVEVFAKSFSPY